MCLTLVKTTRDGGDYCVLWSCLAPDKNFTTFTTPCLKDFQWLQNHPWFFFFIAFACVKICRWSMLISKNDVFTSAPLDRTSYSVLLCKGVKLGSIPKKVWKWQIDCNFMCQSIVPGYNVSEKNESILTPCSTLLPRRQSIKGMAALMTLWWWFLLSAPPFWQHFWTSCMTRN